MEVKMYYSEDFRMDMLELSDKRVIWDINIDIDEISYEAICSQMTKEVERRYKNLKLYCVGRSGRHVCIEDTPVNRRRYGNIYRCVEQAQRDMVEYINKQYNK